MSAETVIRGAGVMGLCAAAELTARGHTLRVLDPVAEPGPAACSWWAGGMLAPDCEGATAEEPVTRLGRQAAGWWAARGVPVTHHGTLVVAPGRDRGELDRFARRTTGHEWLDAAGLAACEPALADRFDRALVFADEAHLDPRAALAHLRERLAAHGTHFVCDAAAPASGTYARVIDCRGLAARDALNDLRGVRGEMLVLRAQDIPLTRPVRLLHPRLPLYVVPRGNGVFMLGATQIESAARGPGSVRSVMELLSAACALHPAFAEAEILEIGADARPAFPDNLPRLQMRDGVIHANGLFRHGFLLAPAVARMLADYIATDEKPELWHEYRD